MSDSVIAIITMNYEISVNVAHDGSSEQRVTLLCRDRHAQ